VLRDYAVDAVAHRYLALWRDAVAESR
jgi:hypothetical protein